MSSARVPSADEVYSQENARPREGGSLKGRLTNGVCMWLIPLPLISPTQLYISFLFLFPFLPSPSESLGSSSRPLFITLLFHFSRLPLHLVLPPCLDLFRTTFSPCHTSSSWVKIRREKRGRPGRGARESTLQVLCPK